VQGLVDPPEVTEVLLGVREAGTMHAMRTHGANLPSPAAEAQLEEGVEALGIVVGGSLTKGVEVRLGGEASVEDISVGRFVTIQAERRRFFGVITDISLEQTDQAISLMPPDADDGFIRRVMSGTNAFGLVHVVPYLTQLGAIGLDQEPLPAKTVPPHFSSARYSAPQEIESIFGANDDHHLWVGSPLDMEDAPICLDADRLTERSTGVFGKTGTGKSFLTRILLAEIVSKNQAVSLVFDMHGEHGWGSSSESGKDVKGLKQLFPGRIGVFTLDDESTRKKGASADYVIRIGYEDIEAADVAAAAGVLNLNETQVQAVERFETQHGRSWLRKLLQEKGGIEGLRQYAGGDMENDQTLGAIWRRLQRFKKLGFLTDERPEDSVRRIMEYLEAGKHVVLEFGRRYRDNLVAYILVANLLTRRIHAQYVDRVETALAEGTKAPQNLVIAVEEAHKFLSPEVVGYTSFGTIAREMRKYNVTLLVIDQRPSGIDHEILSQIGTKLTCLLEDSRDIDAVLAGVSGGSELRAVLSKLETKQQALIFGHAVPMPVVVRTRTYGPDFYKSVGHLDGEERKAGLERDAKDLFGSL